MPRFNLSTLIGSQPNYQLPPATRLLRILLFLLPLALLTACDPALGPGPRIALVGSTRFLSANRLLTIPGDTVTTKLYASTAEQEPLTRVRIAVTFTPQKTRSTAIPCKPATSYTATTRRIQ